jgi:uncharacterized repeat protein (TIGR03987 family)
MPAYLIGPAVLMTLALVFYTLGVWGERFRRLLLGWHVAAFWLGLTFDALGTHRMFLLIRTIGRDPVHTFFGVTAFTLMAGHALWASWVLAKGTDEARAGFHRYSLAVWLAWLVPYVGGMIAGMLRAR